MVHDTLLRIVWPGAGPALSGGYSDHNLLESAVARPFQTAMGRSIHRGVIRKGAALFHSLVANHPFNDGNNGPRLQRCNTFSWQMDGCLLPSRAACTRWQSRRLQPESNAPGRNISSGRLAENLRNAVFRYLFCAASLPTAICTPKLSKQGVTSDVIR